MTTQAEHTQVQIKSNDMIATISSERTLDELVHAVETALSLLDDETSLRSFTIEVNELEDIEH
jgi:hypothetical protein